MRNGSNRFKGALVDGYCNEVARRDYEHRMKIIGLLEEVGRKLYRDHLAELEIHPAAQDVQAFYRSLREPDKVMHVQGYPGLSTDNHAVVWARLMNYDAMMWIRTWDNVSIGNEHDAVIQIFPEFLNVVSIPYDSGVLREKMARSCELFD